MIKYDELRASGRKPRVHGNGFVQLDLNDDGTERLHIWDVDVPRQIVATPIHDHVFDMQSEVLLGTLIHEELVLAQGVDYHVYRAEQQPGTQNTILVPDAETVTTSVRQRLILGAGSVYCFPAFELHTSNHRGLTATVMEKFNAPSDYGRPRVLVPVGSAPDNDFHRDGFDPEFLWSYIERICEELNG